MTSGATAPARADLIGLPMQFQANVGQAQPGVKYLARGRGYAVLLGDYGARVELYRDRGRHSGSPAIGLRLVGGNPASRPVGLEPLATRVNYLVGRDRTRWRTDVPTFGRIRYRQVYPGIDVDYYGRQRELEFDFVIHPGADPGSIVLAFDGTDSVQASESGLSVGVSGGTVLVRQPTVYQELGETRRSIPGRFVMRGDRAVGFRVAPYDRSRPLVVDPVLSYATYLGGSGGETGWAIALDGSGQAFVAGHTGSVDLPISAPAQASHGGGSDDVFIAKLNATGSSLVYCTYFGGSGDEYPYGIAVDSAGSAYVTGTTDSANLPTASPLQGALSGVGDAFVMKLNAAGSALVYSTYLGGSSGAMREYGQDIAVDSAGNAYVAGSTGSADFPTASPYDAALSGALDGFLAKLNAAGGALVYSTYLGGGGSDSIEGLAIDGAGNAYVTGSTSSNNFPLAGAIQAVRAGSLDAFVTKVNASGSALVYSTYLGGTMPDVGYGIAVDGSGSAFVGGITASADFPTPGGFWPAYRGGSWDGFLTRVNAAGSAWTYSTFVGGSGEDYIRSVAVDAASKVYATGHTASADLQTLDPVQTGYGGGATDALLIKLDGAGAPSYATYLGGRGADDGMDVAVTGSGEVYVTGVTGSADYPTRGPVQAALSGATDAFVARIGTAVAPRLWLSSITPSSGGDVGTVSVTVTGTGFAQGATCKLVRSGEPDRVGEGTTVSPSGTGVGTTLPLAGAARGAWDVVVTNPDGTSGALVSAFTVEVGVQPEIWAELVGPTRLRKGVRSAITIAYGNRGNVDSVGGFMFLSGLPADAVVEPGEDCPISLLPAGMTGAVPRTVSTADYGIVVPLWFSTLGPRQTGTFTVWVTFASDGTVWPVLQVAAPPVTGGGTSVAVAETTGLAGSRPLALETNTYPIPPQDAAALGSMFGIAVVRTPTDHFVNRFWRPGDDNACVGASKDLQQAMIDSRTPAMEGWTTRQITKNGAPGLGHTAVMATSPDGQRSYIIDNYLTPIVIPLVLKPESRFRNHGPEDGWVAHPLWHAQDHFPMISANHAIEHLIDASGTNAARFEWAPDYRPYWTVLGESETRTIPETDRKTRRYNVGSSTDPNDKTGPEGAGEQRYISPQVPVPYLISFENLSSATLAAREVVITDVLDATRLDLTTVAMGPVRIGTRIAALPGPPGSTTDVDLRPAQNVLVRVGTNLDAATGTMTWRFTTLDPATGAPPADPLVGFLPPNVTPPQGQGSVTLLVKPRAGLATGTEIRNGATIVFDANAPIVTPEWVNRIDASSPSSAAIMTALSNPAGTYVVSWSGSDGESGPQRYMLLVSVDGGEYAPLNSWTEETSTTFTPGLGHTYRFYTLCRDQAGNIEAAPAAADVTFPGSAEVAPPVGSSRGCHASTEPDPAADCGAIALMLALMGWVAALRRRGVVERDDPLSRIPEGAPFSRRAARRSRLRVTG